MKNKVVNIIRLILALLIIWLNLYGVGIIFKWIHYTGSNSYIVKFIIWTISIIIISIIYGKEIKSGRNKFNRTLLNSLIYWVAYFIFLILITYFVHKFLVIIKHPINYYFVNYFKLQINLENILYIIKTTIYYPFLLSIVFSLGISTIFRKNFSASLFSGFLVALFLIVLNKGTIENNLCYALTPALIMGLLTYLYKNNKNIWLIILTLISYTLLGNFVIGII